MLKRHAAQHWLAFCLMLAACSSACGSDAGPSGMPAQLRVMNVGSRDLQGLVVLFPDQRIEFGNLPAGVTSQYRLAPKGVFEYAAYEFLAGGQIQHQPVIDWVGEEPMEGRAFTYSLQLEETPSAGLRIRLVGTRRDQ